MVKVPAFLIGRIPGSGVHGRNQSAHKMNLTVGSLGEKKKGTRREENGLH